MNAPTDPTPGHMIRGYQLEKRLGEGKLTTLYHARTEELWLPPELTIMLLHIPMTLAAHSREQFIERFTREASHLIKLRHPSLHPLLGYGEEDGQFYLLFPTPTPATTLARHIHKHTLWSPSEAFAILAPLSSAFDYLHHQGLAYQFFSASNILLQEDAAPQITGTGLLQLLLMQGLDEELYSGEPDRHLKNVAGDYMSLSTYLAPEVIRGEPMNTRSDIYSLGILLFELLSGKPPFIGETYMDIAWKHIREPLPSLHAIAPHIPVALELVVNRALHRNPDHRFATAGEFITAFSHVLNERLRSPIYLSHEQSVAQKQTDALSALPNEHRLMPLQQIRPGSESYAHNATSHTPTELPIFSTEDKIDISATDILGTSILDTSTFSSVELSTPVNINKMAQNIHIFRERIQGEYKK